MDLKENDLQHLQMFAQYGRLALGQTGQTPFQTLTVLIRDWRSSKEAPFGVEGGKIVIEKIFKPQDGQNVTNRQVREDILSCFKKIDCYLLMHPGTELTERQDQNGTIEDIRKEFLAQLEDFIPFILAPENVDAKIINGRKVKAYEIISFLEPYMESFRSGSLPTAETLYESNVKCSNSLALSAAFEVYVTLFNTISGMISSIEALDKLNELYKGQAVEKFNTESKLGNEDAIKDYRQKLLIKCNIFYAGIQKVTEKKLKDSKEPVDARFIVQASQNFKKFMNGMSNAAGSGVVHTATFVADMVDTFNTATNQSVSATLTTIESIKNMSIWASFRMFRR